MTGINKGERTELKSIVRQQFKVLRAELEQRSLEMVAAIEDEISARYASDDEKWSDLQHGVHEAVMACNRQINDLIYEKEFRQRGSSERIWITEPKMSQPREKRNELRIHSRTRIAAQVKAAGLDLDRREADLLRTLAVGALESAEAMHFVASIPSVGELVPQARLAELEESLREDQ